MGCCQSTTRGEAQSSPYSPSNAHGDSSRAITSAPTPGLEITSPRASSHAPTTPQQLRSRHIGLGEQFNSPLRAHIWTSKRQWTPSELSKEREEFFDTRVTGRQEVWDTLKMVVALVGEGDVQTAQGILDASGVTLPTGDLINGAYDEVGNFYQLPEHVIMNPVNIVLGSQDDIAKGPDIQEDTDDEVERRREEKGKGVLKSGDYVRVKARLSDRGGPDIVIQLGKEQNIRTLVRRVQEEANISGKGKVKVAYLGKILKDGETLLAQGWREGHVVNALVFL
ncbi:hypothetical protein MMC12_000316 [Toensbergia leucococca]|nr:hypothetical protein [Toensbergia leucococca]